MTRSMTHSGRGVPAMHLARWTVALGAGLAIALSGIAPASAHEGPISLQVAQDGLGGISVTATYLEDGHPVIEAIDPVATAISADGSGIEPFPLVPSDGEGVWVSPEPFLDPGFWTVTVSVTTPSAATTTVNLEVVISEDTPSTIAPAGPEGPRWVIWALGAGTLVFVTLVVAVVVVRLRGRPSDKRAEP